MSMEDNNKAARTFNLSFGSDGKLFRTPDGDWPDMYGDGYTEFRLPVVDEIPAPGYMPMGDSPTIQFTGPDTSMGHKHWQEEWRKCAESVGYFYHNYVLINGQKPERRETDEEFDRKIQGLAVIRKRRGPTAYMAGGDFPGLRLSHFGARSAMLNSIKDVNPSEDAVWSLAAVLEATKTRRSGQTGATMVETLKTALDVGEYQVEKPKQKNRLAFLDGLQPHRRNQR